MPRLFVAIDLPDEIKTELLRLRADIPGARWVAPNQFHLTLHFLGDVETERMPAIIEALNTVDVDTFSLTLEGVGRFPPGRGAARVLWVGIHPDPELIELHRQVEHTLGILGFVPEDRPFSPHLTLARFKEPKPLSAVDQFLAHHRNRTIEAGTVREFVLFSSLLRPQGPLYSREAVFKLSSSPR